MEVSQTLEEKIVEMGARLDRLESTVTKIKSRDTDLMESVLDAMDPILKEKYRGMFVAITYDKKIIESAKDGFEILDKLDDCPTPRDRYFIYEVP